MQKKKLNYFSLIYRNKRPGKGRFNFQRKSLFSLIFLNMFSFYIYPKNIIYIIVHGTWSNYEWSDPSGDFFQELEKSAAEVGGKVISFKWSGQLTHSARITAGKNLAKIIESYPQKTDINIVAHSHGANVGIIASKILGDAYSSQRIDNFFCLGSPVDKERYLPDMTIINLFYNLFSFSDYTQKILGLYQRTYPKHKRIMNVEIKIDDKSPSHRGMHNPIIGKWIPSLPRLLKNNFGQDIKINFYKSKNIEFEIEKNRKKLLREDEIITQKLLKIFTKKNKRDQPAILSRYKEEELIKRILPLTLEKLNKLLKKL